MNQQGIVGDYSIPSLIHLTSELHYPQPPCTATQVAQNLKRAKGEDFKPKSVLNWLCCSLKYCYSAHMSTLFKWQHFPCNTNTVIFIYLEYTEYPEYLHT